MAKKKSKTTYSQQIVGMATMGLPAPVQKVAASKYGSKLLLLLIPFLIASGILTVTFNGGMPTFNFNKDRAAAVGTELRGEAYKAAERVRQYGDSSYR
ncbi:MAG: hypothetical protein K8S94_03870 [Planctomycetia bacterium]|nr:hypothetical protein [Planctomycetia bacterium]